MITPKPGELVRCVQENAITFDDSKSQIGGDIAVSGWMTTEKVNSYKQIVKYDAFEHEDGLSRWNGRIMLQHGRQVLVGGGSDLPIGQMYNYDPVKGEGIKASGAIWADNDPQLKRAIRSGTLNALSIGFIPQKWEEDDENDIVTFTKAQLLEVSVVMVGANDEALFEVTNSYEPNNQTQDREAYSYVIFGGVRYVVNSEGDVCDEC